MKRFAKKQPSKPDALKEAIAPYSVEPAMVRTQVYLTRAEHDFLDFDEPYRSAR